MGLNRKGFSTLLDACIFTVLIISTAPLIFIVDADEPEPPDHAGMLMDVIMSTEVCFDRISDSEEHAVTHLTDILAYSTVTGDPGPMEYIEDVVGLFCPGHAFTLYCVYEGHEVVFGDGTGTAASSALRSIPVSVGGDIVIRLAVF